MKLLLNCILCLGKHSVPSLMSCCDLFRDPSLWCFRTHRSSPFYLTPWGQAWGPTLCMMILFGLITDIKTVCKSPRTLFIKTVLMKPWKMISTFSETNQIRLVGMWESHKRVLGLPQCKSIRHGGFGVSQSSLAYARVIFRGSA
jgi:hypothetical protein